MSKSFKALAAEFGLVKEDANSPNVNTPDNDVSGQLDKAMKMDEVETVTFGLETDDGKIVKVYVQADEADDFEKALSKKLGTEDSIEAALNELSKNYEIVDVEWPEDDDEDEDDDTDQENDDKPETDGSESLNAAVYGKSKGKGDTTHQAKLEGLSFGERFTLGLLEEQDEENEKKEFHDDPNAPIADRLRDANEQLVYHAILELGVPEHALNKNPYRHAIVAGIRKKAAEIGRSHHLRTSVRTFVKQSVDESIAAGDHIQLNEESPADLFFETITKLINFLDGSTNQRYAGTLLESSQFKALLNRAKPELPTILTSDIRFKLTNLNKALGSTEVQESMNQKQFDDFLGSLLAFVDPTDNKELWKNLEKSSPYRNYLQSIETQLGSKTNGVISQRLNDLKNTMDRVYKSKQQQQNTQASSPTATSTTGPTPTTEAIAEEVAPIQNANAKWDISKDDDGNTVLTFGTLKATLNDEAIEKLNKAIKNRTVLTVKDLNEKDKFIFSPRGKSVLVKKVGYGNLQGLMKEADVEQLLGLTDEA
jgi:hypothetical protein